MTETQWLTSVSPRLMLQHIRSRASARKLQLLAVAACRRIAKHFDDPSMLAVVEAVERQAEGELSLDEWTTVVRGIMGYQTAQPSGNDGPAHAAQIALRALVSSPTASALESVLAWAETCAVRAAGVGEARPMVRIVQRWHADLFREVLGNPFLERTVVPEWMSTGGSTIFPGSMIRVSETAKGLADGIQADQAFERLPILADALEEAGCTDSDLLAHMREPGHHVRGCWALDLVLGKG